MDKPLSTHNHYVPEVYLQEWRTGKKIWAYELLVPNENVP